MAVRPRNCSIACLGVSGFGAGMAVGTASEAMECRQSGSNREKARRGYSGFMENEAGKNERKCAELFRCYSNVQGAVGDGELQFIKPVPQISDGGVSYFDRAFSPPDDDRPGFLHAERRLTSLYPGAEPGRREERKFVPSPMTAQPWTIGAMMNRRSLNPVSSTSRSGCAGVSARPPSPE